VWLEIESGVVIGSSLMFQQCRITERRRSSALAYPSKINVLVSVHSFLFFGRFVVFFVSVSLHWSCPDTPTPWQLAAHIMIRQHHAQPPILIPTINACRLTEPHKLLDGRSKTILTSSHTIGDGFFRAQLQTQMTLSMFRTTLSWHVESYLHDLPPLEIEYQITSGSQVHVFSYDYLEMLSLWQATGKLPSTFLSMY
jgi:hypothetical protein